MRNSNPQEHPSEFDPYLKWLGISAAERQGGKPNYYRLLGITPFLDDPDAISHAADRVMGHLRTFQAGKHGAQSQELLSEVVQAKLCLLDPHKKHAYDQTLRAVTPPPAYEVTRSPIAINTGDDGSSSDVRKRLHSNTDTTHWKYAAIIGGSAAAGTAILGGTVAMMRGGDAEDTEPKRAARASMDEREIQGTTFGMPQARLRDDVPAFDPGAATEESAPEPALAREEKPVPQDVLAPVPVREEKPVPQDVLAPSTVQDVPVQEEEVADARDPRRDLADLMSQPQQYPGPRRPVTEQAEDAGAQLERIQQVSAKTLAAVVQRDEQGFAKIMDTLRSEGDGVVRAGMALGAAELAAQCGRVDLLQKALQRLEQDAGAFCTRAEVMLLKADIAMHIAPASITNPMLRRKDEEAWLKNEQQRVDVARVLMDGAMGAWQMDDNAQSSAYLARARQHIFGDTGSGLSGAFVGHKAYKEQGGPARKDLEEMEAENARQAAMLEQVQTMLEGGASPQSSREHQSLGEYLLLARGDWERGLPHIAQGTDSAMAEAAQLTLKGGDTVEERAAVVRAWMRVAEGNERMRRVAENAASLHMRTLKGMTLTGPEKLVVDGLGRGMGGQTDTVSALQQETVVTGVDGKRIEFPKGKWVDVMPKISPQTCTIKGIWGIDNHGLIPMQMGKDGRAIIKLPIAIHGNYSIETNATRMPGNRGMTIQFSVGSSMVQINWAGDGEKEYLGIDQVNGIRSMDSVYQRNAELFRNRSYKISIAIAHIENDMWTIKLHLNDQLITQFQGKESQLSLPQGWENNSLGLGAFGGTGIFNTVKIRLD